MKQPHPADAIPIRILDEGPHLHYPAPPEELQELLRRLPPEASQGLREIHLGLGLDLIREARELKRGWKQDLDPFTGRDSDEVLPGVYNSFFWASWDDGPEAVYRDDERTIYILGVVYGDEPPHAPIWKAYLRFRSLLGFVHALARHRDRMVGEAESADHPYEPQRDRIERLEVEWVLDYLAPLLRSTAAVELASLLAWIEEHGRVALSLPLLLGDPPALWKTDEWSLADGNFSVLDALQNLITGVIKAEQPAKAAIRFARDLHYVEFYEEALTILRAILTEHPGNREALLLEADIYVHRGEFDRARPILLRELEQDPDNRDALDDLLSVHEGKHEWDDFIELAHRLIRMNESGLVNPTRTRRFMREWYPRYRLARAWMEQGELEKASTTLDEIVAMAPSWYGSSRVYQYNRIQELRAEIEARRRI